MGRYFPLEDYPRLREVILSHCMMKLRSGGISPQIRDKPGIWIHTGERISALQTIGDGSRRDRMVRGSGGALNVS